MEVYVFYEQMSDGAQIDFGIYSSLEKALEAANAESRDGNVFIEDKVRVESEESETTPRAWINELDDPEDDWCSMYYINKVTVDDSYPLLLKKKD